MGSRFKSLPLKIAVVLSIIIECSHAKYPENFQFGANDFNEDVNKIIREHSLKDGEIDYRLPTTVIPESYEIMIHPEINGFSFTGTVKIYAGVRNETNEIVLHHGKLSIRSCTVNIKKDGNKLEKLTISNNTYNEMTEKYSILLKENLYDGANIIITIAFDGKLADNMIGFYHSSYFDDNGKMKWLAATQFQATDARQAFPCFDEPAFKAKFSFTILRTKEYKTLSNMPKSREKSFNYTDIVHDIYESTERMSTYLCAFVISDFDYLEKGIVKVWAQPNHVKQAEYALEIGNKSLEYFGKLFDEPYPLKKMDMIAVPDFDSGAMENWGAMLFRSSRMLYNPDESSDYAQQVIASVVVHECAHNWFGNLVTPEWWDSLWLSEGFARYFQYYATAKIEPKWEMEKQFVVDQLQNIFALDGLDSSKPLTRMVLTTSDIGNSGDEITYNKAASIIRMMDLTFGSSTFNEALKTYLKNRKYNSVVPDNLWNALQMQINSEKISLPETVKKIMDSWTTQAGYPILNVTINNGSAEVSQERFYIRNPKYSSKDSKWWIPLTWTTKSENNFETTKPKYWLNKKNDKVNITIEDNEWIIFNIQQAGFYRVNYDQDTWYRIINVLNSESFKEIHEISRAAILDDLLNLARAGYINYTVALDGLKYIINETNYIPLKSAFVGLEYLEKRFTGQPNYELFANYVLKLISRISATLEFDDKTVDNRLNRLLRAEVNSWSCKLSHKPCIDQSKEQFSSFATTAKPVPKNQRSIVYCSSIKHGSHSDWMKLWDRYLLSDSATEQSIILESLGCSQNKTVLENYLLSAITNFKVSRIRRQDSISIFDAVSNSGLFGAEYILDFIQKYHLEMKEYYGDYDTVAEIIATASERFSTKELVDKFSKFIKTNDKVFESVIDSLNDSLELAKFELGWFNKNERSIVKWIQEDNYDDKYRLPTSIVPKSYKIMVTPYLNSTFTFNGTVEILTSVVEETDIVVFHTSEIEYYDMSLSVNGTILKAENIVENTTYQILTITLADRLFKGSELLIKISYSGVLNTALKGFYRSSYVDDKNNTRWLATTHLEPVGARKMFPCFDEPGLKATFDLSVRRMKDYEAISNTKLASSRTDGDRILDTFETTPVMSTYLLALIVSDFEKVSDKDIYSAWAKPNAVDQAKYAVSVISPIINYFEKALGHDYQLPKLDLASIPDFSAGAMENWGLITFKETAMLHHDQHTPTTSKQSIINVIAHEIAHQWFGNLVSPKWWECLWLSEGFARYYQYHATAKIENSWQLESQFVVEALQTSFATDGLSSSHPMTHNVNTPDEISGRFNDISYSKAASVIRMVEKTFGSNFFNRSLHSYLENRKYDTVIPTYLFDAFQRQVDADAINLTASVTEILNTWTLQAGYPVVNVTRSEKIITLTQERFLLSNPDETDIKKLWWIPLTWATESKPDFSNTKPTSWLNETTGFLTVTTAKNEWFILNVQQSGYYRVNYDPNSWETIINVLKSNNFTDIHEINRASIVDDILNLARANYVNYTLALSATEYLVNETNYIPWRAAFNGFSFLNKMFSGKDIYDLYKLHVLTSLKPIYKKLGAETIKGESHTNKILRRYVFNWACNFNDQECISKSKELFASWRSNETRTVPVDLRNTVYCTAIKYGTAEDWEFLKAKSLKTNVRVEKETINSALACTKNSLKLNRILQNAMKRDSNELSLYESIKTVVASGNFGVEYIMNFMKINANAIHEYFKNDKKLYEQLLQFISTELSTNSLINMFQNFVNDSKVRLAKMENIEPFITRAQENIDWYDLHSPEIFEWLDTKYPSTDYRLPTSIIPLKYDIYLTPYIIEKNFTFDGETQIAMKTTRNVSSVVLHANKLTIRNISAKINSVQPLKISSYQLNSTTHRLSIYFTTTVIEETKLTIIIHYTGILNNKMEGFYRSSYNDSSGKTRWLAGTQFQKFGARQAFPCFDEPSMKANFTIYIERENKYHTRSNMVLQNFVPSDTHKDYTWDIYEESVPMSTYLVAFVVSDFEAIHNIHKNFSVWARPNAIEDAKIALDFGEKTLNFLENYTAIEYPLPKVDLIALPDFAAGAMENFGAVTFREYGLLVQESVTSSSYMRYMHTVIAHELTHFWFGDIVTCHWWDRLWLNEGFAEYFQWVTVDAIKPEWAAMDQFVVYALQVALSKDSVSTMRPMDNVMATPYDSGEGNTAIIYGKAASVIHMMRNGFGEEIFRKGLNIYLTKNQYSTGTSEKLWSALQESVDTVGGFTSIDESVLTLMDSWASQPGYPFVHVSVTKSDIELKQERFLITGRNESLSGQPYWIPITYATKSKPTFNRTSPVFWFGEQFEQINNKDILVDEWYILNVKQSGFYRVNYEVKNWERLIEALNGKDFGEIHELNRAQIIDDLLNLAQGDYVSYELALRATKYLENEVKHLPWRSFFNNVAYLVDRFDGQHIESYFKTYVRGLIDKVYKKVGFVRSPLDTQLDGLNRQTILSWACKFEQANCIEQSKTLFEKLKKNETTIDRDAKQALYCTALKYGDFNDWMFLWEEYEKTNLESEKVTILNSLGCTRNETAIEHYFNIVLSRDRVIRDQNVDLVFSSVYKADGFGVNITLQYLIKNYKKLYEYSGSWGEVASLFSSVAAKISVQTQIDELQRFIEVTPELKEISGSLNSSVKIARENLAWYTNHSSTILSWFHAFNEKPDGEKPSSSPSTFIAEHLIFIGLFLYFLTY